MTSWDSDEQERFTFLAQGIGMPQTRRDTIKSYLVQAAASFIEAGRLLDESLKAEDWRWLGRKSWADYCESDLSISDSTAYDLIRISQIVLEFPDYKSRVLDVGISKMRLLLPQLDKHPDEETLDGLLDEAATSTWRELHQTLRIQDSEKDTPWVTVACPACHARLELSRAAAIREAPSD